MGDFLGFAIVALLAIARPAWLMNALRSFRASLSSLSDRLPVYRALLKSWVTRKLLLAAVLVTAFECFWTMAVEHFAVKVPTSVMAWHGKYWFILVYLQLAFAVWNELMGHLEPVYVRDAAGNVVLDAAGRPLCNYMHYPIIRSIVPRRYILAATNFSSPGTWLALVAVTFLVQGWDLELNTIGLRYGSAQTFIALGFVSKLVTGFIVVTIGAIVGLMVKKGTRFAESLSTMLAKVAVGGALPGVTIPDALKDVGGKLDFFDEDYLAAFLQFLVEGPVLPLFVFDVAVYLCPHWFMAKIVMSAIVIVALFAWLLARRTDATRKEVGADMEMSNRVLFKLSLLLVIFAITTGAFLEQTATGRHFVEWVGHVWYGVIGHAYAKWYFYALPAVASGVLGYIMYKAYGWVSARTTKHEANWRSTPLSWMDKAAIVVMCLAIASAFVTTYAGIASAMGGKRIQFDPHLVKNAVGINPNHPPAKPTPGASEVVVDFWTIKPAVGAIVFENPQTAMEAGLPSDIWLESSHEYSNYHRAMFVVPAGLSGRYNIVMRNADENDDELYGKAETFGPYEFGGASGAGGSGGSGGSGGAGGAGGKGGSAGGGDGNVDRGQPDQLKPLAIDPEFKELYGQR